MTIKQDTIKYVAGLARMKLTAQQEEAFARQLNDILAYMDKLNKADTKDIEPMSHAVSMGNVLREDKVKESLSNKEALKNAPKSKDKFFEVPKIIE